MFLQNVYLTYEILFYVSTGDASRLQIFNIMYQMLTMRGNEGHPPISVHGEMEES